MTDIMADLKKRPGCKWQGPDDREGPDDRDHVSCYVQGLDGSFHLYRRLVDETVETVEVGAMVKAVPRSPAREGTNRAVLNRIFDYFLPSWKERSAWLAKALKDARISRMRNVTEIEGLTVLVQWLQPVDLDSTYAQVVITKEGSIDRWRWAYEPQPMGTSYESKGNRYRVTVPDGFTICVDEISFLYVPIDRRIPCSSMGLDSDASDKILVDTLEIAGSRDLDAIALEECRRDGGPDDLRTVALRPAATLMGGTLPTAFCRKIYQDIGVTEQVAVAQRSPSDPLHYMVTAHFRPANRAMAEELFWFVVRSLNRCRERFSEGIPTPVSSTLTSTLAPAARARIHRLA